MASTLTSLQAWTGAFGGEMRQDDGAAIPRRRTVAELFARADALRKAEAQRQARAVAEAQRTREEAAVAAKAKRLDALATRKSAAWLQVKQLVDSKQPKAYDEAVELVADLRDLAARERDDTDFASCIRALREAHAKKPSFIKRLDEAGLR